MDLGENVIESAGAIEDPGLAASAVKDVDRRVSPPNAKPLNRANRVLICSAVLALVLGCAPRPTPHASTAPAIHAAATRPAVGSLTTAQAYPAIDAVVDPPAGWRQGKIEGDARYTHALWISPTRDTAYGVIVVYLPFPIGPDLILWGMIGYMQSHDKTGQLISIVQAPDLPGLRFVADSGQYRLRVNLVVRGWRAWIIYAGTDRQRPINVVELALAEQARDGTRAPMPHSSRK